MAEDPPPDTPTVQDRGEDNPPPRLFGFGYWLAILSAILFICAGYGFARYGAKLFPRQAPPAATAPPGR